jgi:hypothetical protein
MLSFIVPIVFLKISIVRKGGKNYGKAPAVLANLIALGVAKIQVEASAYYLAIPIALLASSTLYVVITIASRENKSR